MRARSVTAAMLVLIGGCSTAGRGHGAVMAAGGTHQVPTASSAARSSHGPSTASATGVGPPRFDASIRRLHGDLRAEVVGRNWHRGCPVPSSDLRAVTVAYWGFDGAVHRGPLVVNETVATDVRTVFGRLFRASFPIKRIALPRKYRPGANRRTDARDTTGAFNCRPVTDDPSTLSQHAFGWAIDINPLQNPYVRADGSVLRGAARPYRDRSLRRRGMIHARDVVVRAFGRIGWTWGGTWSSVKDYMHFSLTGR